MKTIFRLFLLGSCALFIASCGTDESQKLRPGAQSLKAIGAETIATDKVKAGNIDQDVPQQDDRATPLTDEANMVKKLVETCGLEMPFAIRDSVVVALKSGFLFASLRVNSDTFEKYAPLTIYEIDEFQSLWLHSEKKASRSLRDYQEFKNATSKNKYGIPEELKGTRRVSGRVFYTQFGNLHRVSVRGNQEGSFVTSSIVEKNGNILAIQIEEQLIQNPRSVVLENPARGGAQDLMTWPKRIVSRNCIQSVASE